MGIKLTDSIELMPGMSINLIPNEELEKMKLPAPIEIDITNRCSIERINFSLLDNLWKYTKDPSGDNIKSAIIPIKKGYHYKIITNNNDRFGLLFRPYVYSSSYSIPLEHGFINNALKEYSFYNDTDFAFAVCYYNYEQINPEIQVFETEVSQKTTTARESLVTNELELMLNRVVTAYISSNGSVIGETPATTDEIKEWLLNRNTCIYRGKLSKNGRTIVDKDGFTFPLQGVNMFHIPDLAPELHTYETLNCLKYWGVNLVRLPTYMKFHPQFDDANLDMYAMGYNQVPGYIKETMDQIIEWCVELGLYVIVDFHVLGNDDVNAYIDNAIDFFTYFTTKYANTPNVLYEVLNEPHKHTIAQVKDYLDTVVPIIRTNVVTPVIILGRTAYSESLPDIWAWMQANDYDDLFLSSHTYTGSDNALPNYQSYWTSDIPLFISEWGNCELTGYGDRNDERAVDLIDWWNQEQIPHAVWKFADRESTSSLLNPRKGEGYYKKGFLNKDFSANGVVLFKKYFHGNYGTALNHVVSVNEIEYTPETWAEWTTSDTNVQGSSEGLTFTSNGTALFAEIDTDLSVSTKYGLLYEIVENTLDEDFGLSTSSAFGTKSIILNGKLQSIGLTGLQKFVLTSKSSISINKLRFFLSSQNRTGAKITIKNVRLYELPSGSDIEDNFETMSAEALNKLYSE